MTAEPPGARDYRLLFGAYAVTLLATGLAVVGLSLMAFELAGDDAGLVIATALSIKVFAYVAVAPVAAALTGRIAKKPLLLGLDAARAAAILALPLASAPGHLYALVFVFTAASAVHTPTYQALVPHLLPGADDYARALAKSRVATELESAASPAAAALRRLALSYRGLFGVAFALFLLSAALIAVARLPALAADDGRDFVARLSLGPRLLMATPGLRPLIPLHLAAAAGLAMAAVNTVPLVQGRFDLGAREAAIALAVFGAGSVAGALAMPRVLRALGERRTMLAGCALIVLCLLGGAVARNYAGLLALWALLGAATAMALTPAPVLLRRLGPPEHRAALYAALFALGNAALLVAYPAAGWLGAEAPDWAAFGAMAALAAAAGAGVALSWPRPTAPAAPAPPRPRPGRR